MYRPNYEDYKKPDFWWSFLKVIFGGLIGAGIIYLLLTTMVSS